MFRNCISPLPNSRLTVHRLRLMERAFLMNDKKQMLSQNNSDFVLKAHDTHGCLALDHEDMLDARETRSFHSGQAPSSVTAGIPGVRGRAVSTVGFFANENFIDGEVVRSARGVRVTRQSRKSWPRSAIDAVITHWRRERRIAEAIAELKALNDWLLRDIGIEKPQPDRTNCKTRPM